MSASVRKGRLAALHEQQQRKTFLNFVNINLRDVSRHIDDLEDLHTGVELFYMLKAMYDRREKPFPLFQKLEERRIRMHFVQKMNVNMILQHLEKNENVRLHGITALSIVNRELKIIMGLVWSIICRFLVTESRMSSEGATGETDGMTASLRPSAGASLRGRGLSPYQDIVKWVNDTLVKEGSPEAQIRQVADWKTGTALFELSKIFAVSCPDEATRRDFVAANAGKEGNELLLACIEFARDNFDIPDLVSPREFETGETLSITTYMSYWRLHAAKMSTELLKQRDAARRLKAEFDARERQLQEELERSQSHGRKVAETQKERADRLEARAAKLNHELDSLRNDHDDLQNQLATQKSRYESELRNLHEDLEHHKSKLGSELEDLRKEFEAERARKEALESRMAEEREKWEDMLHRAEDNHRDQREDWDETRESLEAALRAERDALATARRDFQEATADQAKQMGDLERSHSRDLARKESEHSSAILDKQAEVDALRDELDALRREHEQKLADSEERLKEARENLSNSEKETRDALHRISLLEVQTSAASIRDEDASRKLTEMAARHEEALVKREAELSEAQRKWEEEKAKMRSQYLHLEADSRKSSLALQHEIDRGASELTALRAGKASLEGELEALNLRTAQQLREKSVALEGVKWDVEGIRMEKQELLNQKAAAEEKLQDSVRQCEELRNQLKMMESDLEQKESEMEDRVKAAEESSARGIVAIGEMLADKQSEIDRLQNLVANHDRDTHDLRIRCEGNEMRLLHLHDDWMAKFARLKKRYDSTYDQAIVLKGALAKSQKEVLTLEDEMDALDEELEGVDEKVHSLEKGSRLAEIQTLSKSRDLVEVLLWAHRLTKKEYPGHLDGDEKEVVALRIEEQQEIRPNKQLARVTRSDVRQSLRIVRKKKPRPSAKKQHRARKEAQSSPLLTGSGEASSAPVVKSVEEDNLWSDDEDW